jgi:hypothetical protein
MTGTETMNQHTILATRLGELTVVRNAEAVVGLYFPHHWYMPGPETFGRRCDEGFDEVARQLKEYLAGGRREFDLPLQARGSGRQRRVWDLVAEVPYGQTITYGSLTGAAHPGANGARSAGHRRPVAGGSSARLSRWQGGDAVVLQVNGESGISNQVSAFLLSRTMGWNGMNLGPTPPRARSGTGSPRGRRTAARAAWTRAPGSSVPWSP